MSDENWALEKEINPRVRIPRKKLETPFLMYN
jgi:hypothetical protein